MLLWIILCCNTQTVSHVVLPEESPLRMTWHGDVTVTLNTSGTSIGHELLWTANTTGTNYEESAVIVVGDIAYIGSCSTHGAGYDKLFAIDITTGDILWSNDTGPGYVGPTVDGDTVYIGSDHHGSQPSNEYLFAFDRFTGQLLWKVPIYGGIAETIQVDTQNLYFCSATENATFYCVNKVDGSIVWTYPTGFQDCANKPMLKDGAIYGAFFNDETTGRMYKVNATTGSLIWSKDLSAGPWDNSITADGSGRIFLAIYGDATLNAYHESDGGLIWSQPLHGSPLSFNAVHNGFVFIADTEGYVYCFETSSGALCWETKIGDVCDISSPTLSGGLLFIGTHDTNGALLALSEMTGEILWRYSTGCSITAPPSVANGMMFCGSDGWNAYAFDIGDGSGNWSLHRYDSWNTAYSPMGLSNWQYVRTDCSDIENNITCIITNVYDHIVHNITLSLPYPASWYDDEGVLLANKTCTYTIPYLDTGENLTLFIVPVTFTITITKPQPGIYLANFRILPFRSPLIIGNILVHAEVQFEDLSQIDRVEFFLDNDMNMMMRDGEPPYEWFWKQRSFGHHILKATAYLSNGSTSDECSVFRIF